MIVAAAMALFGQGDLAASGGNVSSMFLGADGPLWGGSLALDTAGNPVVSFYDETNGDLGLLKCDDQTCTSGSSTALDTNGDVGAASSLVLDDGDVPVVSYYDVGNGDLKVLRCGNSACASGNSVTVPDSVNDVGQTSSITLSDSGNPIVSYSDVTDGALKILRCGDPTCTIGNSITTPDSGWGQFSSIVLDAAGFPAVSYKGDFGLNILRCGDPECSAGNVISVPDYGGLNGGWTSIALDATGNPVVSYADLSPARLLLLHCGDATCSSGNTIAEFPPAFGNTSLSLDDSGNPLVAFRHSYTAELQLLRCDDPNCLAGGDAISNPDNRAEAAMGGMKLRANGNPVVAYTEQINGALTILSCQTPTCNPDLDGDGCFDLAERETVPNSQLAGGLRDPKNPNDYFNPTGDGQNRIDDVLAVVDAYYMDDNDGNPGLPPYAPGYNPNTDRTLLGPDPWDTGPPNGLQRIDDILNAIKQYFHDCA